MYRGRRLSEAGEAMAGPSLAGTGLCGKGERYWTKRGRRVPIGRSVPSSCYDWWRLKSPAEISLPCPRVPPQQYTLLPKRTTPVPSP